MAILPVDEEGLIREGLDLLPITPEGFMDVTYKIPLPRFVYWPVDSAKWAINKIRNIFPEETAGQPPVPAAPAPQTPTRGMAYSTGKFFPKTGEKAYRWLKKKAENEGFVVRELPYETIQRDYATYEPLQGHENGSDLVVMEYDRDGREVCGWKKARILGHEYIGAKHFTRRGKPHEANHRAIESMTDQLLDELAYA